MMGNVQFKYDETWQFRFGMLIGQKKKEKRIVWPQKN